MKKWLVALGLMALTLPGVFGQDGKTWYYRYVETIDPHTGEKNNNRIADEWDISDTYITFTRKFCYVSDEKGNIQYLSPFFNEVYIYQGEENDLYVFMYYNRFQNRYEDGTMLEKGSIYFSKDLKRMNFSKYHRVGGKKGPPLDYEYIYVYELADPPPQPSPYEGPGAPLELF